MLTAIIRRGAAALIPLAAVSCQTYREDPFDPAAFADAWHARALTSPTIVQYAEQLARQQATTAPASPFDPVMGSA